MNNSLYLSKKDVFDYLKTEGFQECSYNEEGAFFVEVKLKNGVIIYGQEYQFFMNGVWQNPTEPAFSLWSGLGDNESYGFKITASTLEEVKRVVNGFAICLSEEERKTKI